MKRSAKLIGIVLLSTLAAVALFAVSSASATVLCKENVTACPSGSVYSSGTTLEGTLKSGTKLELTGKGVFGTLNLVCSGSTMSGKSTAEKGTPLTAEISGLTFSGCSGCSSGTARNLPYAASVERTEAGKGTATLSSGGKGGPSFEFTDCLAKGIGCVFGAGELHFDAEGGAPAVLTAAKEASLKRESGSGFESACPEVLTVKALSYEVTSPKPLYVTGGPRVNESVLCKENTPACATGSTYAGGTTFTAKSQHLRLKFSGIEIDCGSSQMSLKNKAESGNPLAVEVTSLTTSPCSGGCQSMEAAVPIAGSVSAVSGGNGTMKATFHLNLFNCPAAGGNCVYSAEQGSFTVTGGGSETADISAWDMVLTRVPSSSEFCSTTAKLSADYFVSSPAPVYVTKAES